MPKATAIVHAGWQLGQMSHWQATATRWPRGAPHPGRVSRALLDRLYRLNY